MLSLRHLTFVDPREDVIAELRTAFQGETRVTCVVGRFEDLPEYDCFVSAANSFGMMDGGVDAAITRYFGTELMARVQARIREGTFTGKVSPRAAAQQMALAFQCADQPLPVMQWESLKLRQRLIDEAKRE